MTHLLETPRGYGVLFAVLLALTALTVGLGYFDIGVWHTPIGLAIAATKASLIVLFFMHVYTSNGVIWLVALSGLFWLVTLIGLTLTDVLTRGWSIG